VSYLQPSIVGSRPLGERLVDVLRAVRVSWEASKSNAVAVPATTTLIAIDARPVPQRRPIELDPRWIAIDDASAAPETKSMLGAGSSDPEPACPLRGHTLRARLLGSFEVQLDGVEITEWHGQLGPAILRFLLAQPRRACPRDVLLEQFWPGADPYRARNRLHVALTALRQAMRGATSINVVQFHDGVYKIAPQLDVFVDVDDFEQQLDEAQRADIDGRDGDVVAALDRAIQIYRGDYLADAPYEQWASTTCEALRTRYLDALDRLAAAYTASGRTDRACDMARRILKQDPCREDAHRTLMRAAAMQGRPQEVARQYELCRRALADDLGVYPAPATTALYREARAAAAERRNIDWGTDDVPRRGENALALS
jgi:DNA-binding SARP family transcriptional activator